MSKYSIRVSRATKPRASHHSFTLVELLVACVIFTFVMLILMSLLSQSSRIWQRNNGEKQGRESARILFQLIGRDMESAIAPSSVSSVFRFQLNPTVSGGGNYLNPTAAFWQTTASGTGTNTGDIGDVGYFVNWVTIDGMARSTLCRLIIPATDSDSIFQSTNRVWSYTLINHYAPGLNATASGSANAYKGLVAENVIGLWMTLYSTNMAVIGNGLTPYDSRTATLKPAYADVSIAVLNPDVAQRLTSADVITNCYSGSGATNAAAFATSLPAAYREATHIFTTRFQIRGAE